MGNIDSLPWSIFPCLICRPSTQTAAILQYLAPQLKLVDRSEQARTWTHQIQLTLCDLVAEAPRLVQIMRDVDRGDAAARDQAGELVQQKVPCLAVERR